MMIAHKRAYVLFMFAEPNSILCRYNPILCKDKDKILFQYNKKVKKFNLTTHPEPIATMYSNM